MKIVKLLAVYASLLTTAHSHPLDCKSESLEPHARLICDYAILNNNYEKIYKDQTQKLESRQLSTEELSAWNSELSECQTVKCIDAIFEKWDQLSIQTVKEPLQQKNTPTTTERLQKNAAQKEKTQPKDNSENFYIYIAVLGYLIQKDFRKKDGRTSNGYKNNAPAPSILRRLIGWSILCFALYHLFQYL